MPVDAEMDQLAMSATSAWRAAATALLVEVVVVVAVLRLL